MVKPDLRKGAREVSQMLREADSIGYTENLIVLLFLHRLFEDALRVSTATHSILFIVGNTLLLRTIADLIRKLNSCAVARPSVFP